MQTREGRIWFGGPILPFLDLSTSASQTRCVEMTYMITLVETNFMWSMPRNYRTDLHRWYSNEQGKLMNKNQTVQTPFTSVFHRSTRAGFLRRLPDKGLDRDRAVSVVTPQY